MTVVSVRLFRTFALFRTRRFKNGSRAFLQAPLHPDRNFCVHSPTQ
jgi:hypothetical protein